MPNSAPDNNTAILWSILFDEDYDSEPNPNKPENVVYYAAKRRDRAEKLKIFLTGPGSALFLEWKARIKRNLAGLMAIPEKEMCHCAACMKIRESRQCLELLMEAEKILSAQKLA